MSSYLQAGQPPDASATVRGLMNTTAQILAGLKTFLINSAGASDVSMRIGTTAAAPTAFGAGGYRALSIVTGIGGSEVEWVNVRPEEGGSDYSGIINMRSTATNKAAIDITYPGGGPGFSGGISWATWNGGSYVGPYSGQQLIAQTTNRGIHLYTQLDAYLPAGTPHLKFGSANNGGSDPTRARFSFETDPLSSVTARHSRWMVDGVEQMNLRTDGLHLKGATALTWDDVWGSNIYANSGYLYMNPGIWCPSIIAAYGVQTSNINVSGDSQTKYSTIGGYETAASAYCLRLGATRPDADVDAACKLVSIGTGTAGTYVEKAYFNKDGTIELTGAGVGIVLASPNGTRFRVTVNNAGALTVAAA